LGLVHIHIYVKKSQHQSFMSCSACLLYGLLKLKLRVHILLAYMLSLNWFNECYFLPFEVWNILICEFAGDVELTNMQLRPEALNALKLPVKVKSGFLGSIKLKVCSLFNVVSNMQLDWKLPTCKCSR
jgi:hypothetical protein